MFLIRTADPLPLAQRSSMPVEAVKEKKEITEEKVCSHRKVGA